MKLEHIRNFSIIAHIDHGKSTVADRLIHMCGGLTSREMSEQVLDNMEIEKERGITIKSQTVRLNYKAKDGITYQLNLMDTPGHVDFAYEVSRSLASCEGSILIVDAAQGVEAQTLANVYQAIDNDHEIIPVINKIDLPAAEPEKVMAQIEDVIGIDCSDAVLTSAKTGIGMEELLEAIVTRLPCPQTGVEYEKQKNHSSLAEESKRANDSEAQLGGGAVDSKNNTPHSIVADSTNPDSQTLPQGESAKALADIYNIPLKALLVDSWYDAYLGVVILVRVIDGVLKKGQKIKFMQKGVVKEADQVGIFTPKIEITGELKAGEMGFITAQMKDISETSVGDTITTEKNPCEKPLDGFKPSVPVVFCSLFPVESNDFETLRSSLGKLALNDASFKFEMETSQALGFGFRCGFLGLLHMEIIQERLEREFDLDLVATAPSVVYKIGMTNGETIDLYNPVDMPDIMKIETISEPWIKATIMTPDEYLGPILTLCQSRRGVQENLTYVGSRAMVVYKLPLNEVVFDFYDRIKSISQGYASFDYEIDEYKIGDLVKLTILVNGEEVDSLAMIVNKANAEARGRKLCEKLKTLIPRQLFKIAVQAAIGGNIVARETISAMRKDVTAKCYGGDISRKRKLLDKQKKGKKRMRTVGNVEIPQKAFIAALKMDDD